MAAPFPPSLTPVGALFCQRRLESAAVRLAVDDQVVRVARETIDGALGANRVGEGHEPLVRPAIRRDDNRPGAMRSSRIS